MGHQDEAVVVGFADDDAAISATVKVLVAGLLDYPSAIDPGDVYFLSTTPGEITLTAPSTAGQYVTRVGEGATTTEFSIQIEPPILIVLMSGTTDHRPYAPNQVGVNGVLLDLKTTMAGRTVYAVAGFGALAFEDVTQGAALYARASDGKVGLANASGTRDEATVVGFAQTAKNAGEEVRCLVVGILATIRFRCRGAYVSGN